MTNFGKLDHVKVLGDLAGGLLVCAAAYNAKGSGFGLQGDVPKTKDFLFSINTHNMLAELIFERVPALIEYFWGLSKKGHLGT